MHWHHKMQQVFESYIPVQMTADMDTKDANVMTERVILVVLKFALYT